MIKELNKLKEIINVLTDSNNEKDTFKYIPLLNKFESKIPSIKNIKNHEINNISDDYNIRFQYKHININIEQNGTADYYPVTNNEILSLLNFYGRLKQLNNITIKMYKQLEIQGLVSRKDKKTLPETLVLIIPSEKAQEKYEGKSLKWLAMHTLLHEISHLMGNITNFNMEPMADDFADMEIIKWQKIMKF